VEKIKAYNLYSITFSRKSCRLWDNVEKNVGRAGQVTDDNITRRIRVACWIDEATDTYSEYAIFIAFRRQHWLREHASVCNYAYIACLVCFQPPVDTHANKRTIVLVKYITFAHIIKGFPTYMGPKCSLLYSQKPDTPESAEPSPPSQTPFIIWSPILM